MYTYILYLHTGTRCAAATHDSTQRALHAGRVKFSKISSVLHLIYEITQKLIF